MHIAFTTLYIFLSVLAGSMEKGAPGLMLSLGIALLCFAGMTLARVSRKILSDIYRQFKYREKFTLFLVHAGILFVLYLLGLRDFHFLGGVLMVAFSLQGMNHLFYGRILFVGLLMIVGATWGASWPPSLLLAGWLFLFLLSARMGHLRWRIQPHDQCRGIGADGFVLRAVRSCLLPAIGAWGALELLVYTGMSPRALHFDGMQFRPDDAADRLTSPVGVWEMVFLVAIIIGSLLALWWLDRMLRSQSKGDQMGDEVGGMRTRAFSSNVDDDDTTVLAPTTGPRQRVLWGFKDFSRRLGRLGLARGEYESAEAWMERIAAQVPLPCPVPQDVFNMACYSAGDLEERDAEAYLNLLDREYTRIAATVDNLRGG